ASTREMQVQSQMGIVRVCPMPLGPGPDHGWLGYYVDGGACVRTVSLAHCASCKKCQNPKGLDKSLLLILGILPFACIPLGLSTRQWPTSRMYIRCILGSILFLHTVSSGTYLLCKRPCVAGEAGAGLAVAD
ncbi:hypothetical protein QBC42DRAFT_265768, partial [Cladorrhinum samala]